MASSSSDSGCSYLHVGDVHVQQHIVMEERKRKRLVSNRESARRSRMRKQHHLDDLISQSCRLRSYNIHIITSIDITTRLCLDIEAENALLRVQMAELGNRLQSLNEIIDFINSRNNSRLFVDIGDTHFDDIGFIDLWTSAPVNQPILASADMSMMY